VETARATAGVEGVTDETRVRAGGADAPAVQRALRANPSLAPYPLEVREEGGRLVLRGRVRTSAEKDLAGLLAREAAGVPIENVLQIHP
jgi:osmotically-inducible protein OsmY